MVIYRFLLNIWCNLLKFKNGNFKTISYGAMIYNFIERKESIFTYVYLGFLYILLNLLEPFRWNRNLENFSNGSCVHIDSNSNGLSYRLVHIWKFTVSSDIIDKYFTYFAKILTWRLTHNRCLAPLNFSFNDLNKE
jgi:hypothetical protein